MRAPKTGGPTTTLATTGSPGNLAVDDTSVYRVEGPSAGYCDGGARGAVKRLTPK